MISIKDEPFAAGYINSGTDDIYLSTGAGYLEAAKSLRIVFDPDTGFPSFDLSEVGCFPTFSSGQTPNTGLLEYKAEQDPEHAGEYRLICEKMKKYDVGARLWASFSKNARWRQRKASAVRSGGTFMPRGPGA